MFNPRQAQEDQYVLSLALLLVLGIFVLVAFWNFWPGGARYWLLTLDSRQTLATIDGKDKVVPADESRRHMLRNTGALGEHVVLRYSFQGNDSELRNGEVFYPDQGAVPDGGTLPIVYWQRDTAVSMPVDMLPRFRFDGLALLWVSGAAVILAGLSALVVWRWIAFRSSAIRY